MFNAGMGAVFTRDQTHELDACVMDGYSLQAGAVAGVKHLRNPVLAARLVLEKSPHVLLIGEGRKILPSPTGWRAWITISFPLLKGCCSCRRRKRAGDYPRPPRRSLDERQKMGTVGAVALDLAGNLAAATSTGGMTNKLPGRVGDSLRCRARGAMPIMPAWRSPVPAPAEVFMRTLAAYDIAALMEYGRLESLFRLRAGGDGGNCRLSAAAAG